MSGLPGQEGIKMWQQSLTLSTPSCHLLPCALSLTLECFSLSPLHWALALIPLSGIYF